MSLFTHHSQLVYTTNPKKAISLELFELIFVSLAPGYQLSCTWPQSIWIWISMSKIGFLEMQSELSMFKTKKSPLTNIKWNMIPARLELIWICEHLNRIKVWKATGELNIHCVSFCIHCRTVDNSIFHHFLFQFLFFFNSQISMDKCLAFPPATH